MEVRKKRPRGFKKEAQGVQVSPLDPLSVLLTVTYPATAEFPAAPAYHGRQPCDSL
jgi:hypothetical protein